jgi:acylglycerol lipase
MPVVHYRHPPATPRYHAEMPPITHTESHFVRADGLSLYRQSWLPGTTPLATVAIVHGYAEHSGRYTWVGEQLAEAGYAVHAYDLRGHGQSEGPRVLVRSFNEHLNDLAEFLRLVRAESQGARPVLLGHSMGGCIAALYTVTREPDLRGLVLSGPAISLPSGVGMAVMSNVVRVIGRVRPSLPVRALKAASVSRDPAVVEAYATDPLVHHGGMPAGTLAAIGRAIARIDRDMERVTQPLLLIHGADDELCDPEGSRHLYERASSADKTLKLYDGLAHEVLNEPEKEQVLADVRAWLDAH